MAITLRVGEMKILMRTRAMASPTTVISPKTEWRWALTMATSKIAPNTVVIKEIIEVAAPA